MVLFQCAEKEKKHFLNCCVEEIDDTATAVLQRNTFLNIVELKSTFSDITNQLHLQSQSVLSVFNSPMDEQEHSACDVLITAVVITFNSFWKLTALKDYRKSLFCLRLKYRDNGNHYLLQVAWPLKWRDKQKELRWTWFTIE